MPLFASVIASIGLILSGWLYTHPVEQTPALGASQTISSLTSGTSLDDADVLPYTETSSLTTKKITWANATSTLKTFYDTIYSPIFTDSATFFGLISDETGSAGGVVRATSPSLTTPTLTAPTLDVAGTDATGDLYYNGGSGLLTRLADAVGTGYYLMSSSTTGLPEWNNSVATFPYNASSTFTSTVTISGSTTLESTLSVASTTVFAGPVFHTFASTTLHQTTSGTTYTLSANDTVRAQTSTSYVKMKETLVGMIQGPVSVYFECKGNTAFASSTVYINGVSVGTPKNCGNGFFSGATETFNVKPQDLVQVYGKNTDGGGSVDIQYFRIQVANGSIMPVATLGY